MKKKTKETKETNVSSKQKNKKIKETNEINETNETKTVRISLYEFRNVFEPLHTNFWNWAAKWWGLENAYNCLKKYWKFEGRGSGFGYEDIKLIQKTFENYINNEYREALVETRKNAKKLLNKLGIIIE